jgi:hypothetical protein
MVPVVAASPIKNQEEATHDQNLALLRAPMLSRLVCYGSDFAAEHTARTATTSSTVYSAATSTTTRTATPSTTGAAKCRTGALTLFVSRWRL